ncbi:DpnII family type II restriction endonuclease [Clostridium perfringens]|uniref:DpnII family type II restriction endonuclease n=1 Tax=Clostridium perfringens TaxID=1502 RepID=UPI002B1FA2F7|nr:DpnII family type II restriction endonuclease [Clostridium perfringens]MEA5272126.1 DpnII family type II restriction endonuclease [Clostridium perfringens]MEA5312199.1 DpnII family type II restriction endonuclease [Clostridium perfringens]MEA5342559.1 DpnII family type II restriction endonuclease [Clostridium perfringens]
MKPFLKWAGGKTQLLDTITSELPENMEGINTYIEPFVGAGAVFLDFLSSDRFEKYIINDINSKLINVYKVIRDDIDLLIESLNDIKEKYLSFEELSEDREKMYYEIRDKFNSNDIGRIELASYFIFINKTCFNGLYRENSKGNYNVPIGKYKNPTIFDEEQLREISRLLNKRNNNGKLIVTILNLKYTELEEYINKSTFVYFDPPYRPVTVGGFSTYNKGGFNDESQQELADFYTSVSRTGAKLMLSNSDPRILDKNDDFFEKMYGNFYIQRVYANRFINSKGADRGGISELLITNYKKDNRMYIGDDEKMENISKVYTEKLNFKNADEVFEHLVGDVKDTIKGWDYFVNWEKAVGNMKAVEKSLNVLNYLIGKENIEQEARELIAENPQVINVFPILVASRDKDFKILEPTEEDLMNFKEFDFSKKRTRKDDLSEKELSDAIEFLKKTNLLKLFEDKTIKSLVDYVLGVEVGLDSNARKNRTGTAMEDIVEVAVKKLCNKHGWEYKTQATVKEINERWGIVVPTDKSARRYDFAINNNGKLLLAEVNYYNGGGSKLKTVANEFTKLDKYMSANGFQFCWITDGLGWNTAKKPLRDAFDNMRQILNLDMIEKGALEYLVENL